MAMTLKPQNTPSEQLREWMRYVHYYQHQVLNCIKGREQRLVEKIQNRDLFERMFYLQAMQELGNRLYMVAAVPQPLRPSAFSILIENTLLFIEGQEDEYDKRAWPTGFLHSLQNHTLQGNRWVPVIHSENSEWPKLPPLWH